MSPGYRPGENPVGELCGLADADQPLKLPDTQNASKAKLAHPTTDMIDRFIATLPKEAENRRDPHSL